jgi:hypothetical protein
MQLCVERNDWRGHVSTTKGGRLRHVPMTNRLAVALRDEQLREYLDRDVPLQPRLPGAVDARKRRHRTVCPN